MLSSFLAIAIALGMSVEMVAAQKIMPPPDGKLYHGCYWGGIGTDTHDPTEHDVTAVDVARYEQAVGARAAWVYFSHNWFESPAFPRATCDWIHQLGKVPYIRLMLRSDVDQKHSEERFTLQRIVQGDFDRELRQWGRDAKEFGAPIMVEWGTEPNGEWFSWNGKWHGRGASGPRLFIEAYRHIVDLIREAGATNMTWVWHVNWDDQPETKWNRLENYYPGDEYCDWLGFSAYGPTTPRTPDETESLRFKIDKVYSRLTTIAPDKPIILAEFGCDIHNRHLKVATWAKSGLEDLFSHRWPRIIGFCWWNEGWQNDDVKKHDSDLIITHDAELTRVFRDELTAHAEKIQEKPVIK